MPVNIGLRLHHKGAFIIVNAKEDDTYQIEIRDIMGRDLIGPPREEAIEFLLARVSKLRHQAYKMLGRKPKTRNS